MNCDGGRGGFLGLPVLSVSLREDDIRETGRQVNTEEAGFTGVTRDTGDASETERKT